MTEEVRGAITSDKVETDNTNFATVRADQTCEEVLIPRENAFRQLTWQVTLEKGAVYNPQEEVGIYADELDCKYGVQINGDVFGRSTIAFEYGGAAHSEAEADAIGTRVFGSVLSEGQVEVTEPTSKMDDWAERPVTVYGDVIGTHITFDRPTIVYGNVDAENTFRTNAPTIVLGEVRSAGIVEASDLFAFSISAGDDITLGENVVVINPTVWSESGEVRLADRVGVFDPNVFEHIQQDNDIETIGAWAFDGADDWLFAELDAIWDRNVLVPADVTRHEEGEVASRAWRTVEEPPRSGFYEAVRSFFVEMAGVTRNDPPDIEEFRYAGLASLGEGGGTQVEIQGDMVIGSQQKEVQETDLTKIDQSTTEIRDESTTVEDSVVNRSDIGGDDESAEEAATEADAEGE